MSYDLMVFEPNPALREAAAFDAWFEKTTDWDISSDAGSEPQTTSPKLQAFYRDMIGDFPAMNGPDATVEEGDDDSRVTGYSFAPDAIYMDFRWSEAGNGYKAVQALAAKHGIGFFDPQSSQVVSFGEDGYVGPPPKKPSWLSRLFGS